MLALTEAAMHVIAGESDVSLIAGAGIGLGGGAGGINDVRWAMDRFPFHEVVDRYPSTCSDRLSFRNESVRKAKDTASGSHGTGLIPLSLPPYFDRVISRDDLMDYEPEPSPADSGPWCEEPAVELVFDFSAPYREGAGVIALRSMENSSCGAPDVPFRLTGFRHLGVPPHLGGLGAAVALESLLSDKNTAVETIDVVEILELTTAQTISSLKRIRSLLPRDGDNGGNPGAAGPVFSVNPHGGSLVYGHVPACSGIHMIASLMEYLNGTRSRTGAVLCEEPSGEAVALTFERGWGENV